MSSRSKIAVAMSGGVDSSAACAVLKEQNYDIVGVTLLLKGEIDEHSRKSIDDTVNKLDIQHHYIDCRQEFFNKVIMPSAIEYTCGKTPNPCCLCNPDMKFAAIMAFADKLGIGKAATGHYAAIKEDENGFYLERGEDSAKDQSYFLYRLNEKTLKRLIFPLAEMTKKDIRIIAEKAGLIVFDRPDSQDVCFAAENECCGETLRRLAGLPIQEGNFIYQGKIVGRHKGIHLYTIGQRKGLGVALGVPAYISAIDHKTADIELVTDESLLALNSFAVKNAVWNYPVPPEELSDITVKIRYRTTARACSITRRDGIWQVKAKEGFFRAVTPGQSAVFYLQNRLLGGGIIC